MLRRAVVIGGDINIHMKDVRDADTQRLASPFDAFDLRQHVNAPTRLLGGTLDLVATFWECSVTDVSVDPAGVISDHSLITCRLPSSRHTNPPPTRVVRGWRKFDRLTFTQAVGENSLRRASSPFRFVDDLFAEYDSVLGSIADRFAIA